MNKRDTFKIDNQLIQWTPTIFGRRSPAQLYLPGINETPLGPFDEWATYGLYALLDPKNPGKSIKTTPSKLLEVLRFAKEISSALNGYTTYKSDDYQMIEDALHRLYSVELVRQDSWNVKTKAPVRGRPSKKGQGDNQSKRQLVVFRGRIIISYALIYPEGVTPAHLLPPEDREDINRSRGIIPDAPAIWKAKKGPRPEGIEIRLHPDLLRGLTGEDPNIGATLFPFKIFELRKTFIGKPIATRLLVWVMRQARTDAPIKRDLDGLSQELNIDPGHPKKTRATLLNGFKLLLENKVIEAFETSTDETTGRTEVVFTKSKTWYLPTPDQAGEDVEETAQEAENG